MAVVSLQAFLAASGDAQTLSAADQEELFKRFLEWRAAGARQCRCYASGESGVVPRNRAKRSEDADDTIAMEEVNGG